MCHAFMLRHAVMLRHDVPCFYAAPCFHGQHNTAAHGSVDVYSRELFISYEHTAEHWNLMQDSLLFFGGVETHIGFGEFSR